MAEGKPSTLYEKHLELTDKSRLTPFAGYLMPLWYTSISREHRAVREQAGLFDCTHMGVWQITGPEAAAFVDALTTNRAAALAPGRAQYAYVLDQQGQVLDDIIVYRRGSEDFMLVVNAANNEKMDAWFHRAPAQLKNVGIDGAVQIHDLRHTPRPRDNRVDIALQGPLSCQILVKILDKSASEKLQQLKPFHFFEASLENYTLIISATGYTGAKVGYELFPPPAEAPRLWDSLIQAGRPLGLEPCGLGARDSLRIEAGLPLYGHELAGPHRISPFAAGYGWAVKLDKKFFIGREKMQQESTSYTLAVRRLEFPGRPGVRPLRNGDAVLDQTGKCLGWITSGAKVDEKQIALALLDRARSHAGDPVGLYYLARNPRHVQQGRRESIAKDESLQPDINGIVVERMAKF